MPMPAVTLKQSTNHRSQNCGVLMALFAETCPPVKIDPASIGFGVKPAGFQSSRGSRTSNQPSDMNTAYTMPCTRKVREMPEMLVPNEDSILVDHGEAMSAPPPKPMIAMPVAIPGRSGNHLIKVETGEM